MKYVILFEQIALIYSYLPPLFVCLGSSRLATSVSATGLGLLALYDQYTVFPEI